MQTNLKKMPRPRFCRGRGKSALSIRSAYVSVKMRNAHVSSKRFVLGIFQITLSASNLQKLWEVSEDFFSAGEPFRSFDLGIFPS